jgi:hypothetical protein
VAVRHLDVVDQPDVVLPVGVDLLDRGRVTRGIAGERASDRGRVGGELLGVPGGAGLVAGDELVGGVSRLRPLVAFTRSPYDSRWEPET